MTMTPAGIIVVWAGSIAEIPPGWAHCDGDNGTPDLTDAFIPGVGGLYEFDDRQGGVEHDHYSFLDSHLHDMAAGSDLGSGASLDNKTNAQNVQCVTTKNSHLPPYKALVYMMKT